MNQTLREKIAAIAGSTSSKEVKTLCESLLQKKVITQAEFDAVSTKHNSSSLTTASKSLEDAKMAESKAAAKRLMESWSGKPAKVTNVGFEKKNEVDPLEVKNISEQMIAIGGMPAAKAARMLSYDSYGIAEAIQYLRGTDVVKRFTEIRYALDRFERDLREGASESSIVRTFVSTMNSFNWDKNVAEAVGAVESRVNEAGLRLDVQNTIEKVKASDSKNFFSTAVGAMNSFVMSESSQAGLVRNLKPWSFNNHVKDLLNKIAILENEGSKGIPAQYDAKAKEVNSPVLFAKGVKVFKAGNNFFGYNDDSMFRLSPQQINALPKEFHELAEAFSMPYVSVSDGDIIVRVGDAKATIGDTLAVNGKTVDRANFANMLSVASHNTLRRTNEQMKTAMYLLEHKDEIYNIDFAKHVKSMVYEGFEAYVFRIGDKVYINKINSAMNEDKLFGASGQKAVRYIKENFGLDISSTIQDIITDNSRRALELNGEIDKLAEEVKILEANVAKLDKAIKSVGAEQELTEAKDMVSEALSNARDRWNALLEEKDELEGEIAAEEEKEEELVDMDLDFDVQVEPVGNGKFELTVTAKPKVEEEAEEEEIETEEEEKEVEREEDEGRNDDEPEVVELNADEIEASADDDKDKKFVAQFNESLAINSKVKLAGSDREGVISGETEGKYTVTWEDGGSSDHLPEELVGIGEESAAAVADNEIAGDKLAHNEDIDIEIEIGAADNADNATDVDGDTFIDVKVNADFGEYKVGDVIKVSASQFTASGDDDAIATEAGGTIVKKFVDLDDTSKADAPADIRARIDAAMAELDAIKRLADEGGITIDISGVIAGLEDVTASLDGSEPAENADVMINDPVGSIAGEDPEADSVIEVPDGASVNVDVIDADGEQIQSQIDDEPAPPATDEDEEEEEEEEAA